MESFLIHEDEARKVNGVASLQREDLSFVYCESNLVECGYICCVFSRQILMVVCNILLQIFDEAESRNSYNRTKEWDDSSWHNSRYVIEGTPQGFGVLYSS